jgi:uncharacterized protein with ParB-like and HNH nuclease domain
MSNQQSLKQFLAGKVFEIPQYQRSYAWEKQNVIDLFNDIQEASDTGAHHYIGTVVLARTSKAGVFNIVDGQQRITTIVMFISAILKKLENKDQEFYRRLYIKDGDQFALSPLSRDREFYFNLLDGMVFLEPKNKSQRFMLNAYSEMENIVNEHIKDPIQFIREIEALSILEFVENNESDAIRIFQTVNDRGRALSKMDKMKSLLFYSSNKYLNQKYDDEINDKFGEIFELYDHIKLTGENQKIDVISSKQFTEDDLLRHHHICFSEESFDPSAKQVLENVKSKLSAFGKNKEFEQLDIYISKYLDSLLEYVRAFNRIINKTIDNEDYYKLFSILGLSAVYYPAITQLEKNLYLDQILPGKKISVLKMVEIIDVRVLKIREYAGTKYIANFAFRLNNFVWTIQKIEDHLLWFNSFEISNDRFKDYLANYNYSKVTGLLRILFIDYCERLEEKIYLIAELKKIMESNPTIEHILSQNPKFQLHAYGFENQEEFDKYKHLIGNLTLLEKTINSSIQNDDLVEKVNGSNGNNGYRKSKFKMTSILATSISITNTFKKEDLEMRNQQLVEDFSKRWWA